MKLTKARLRQIIEEEFDVLKSQADALKRQKGQEAQKSQVQLTPSKTINPKYTTPDWMPDWLVDKFANLGSDTDVGKRRAGTSDWAEMGMGGAGGSHKPQFQGATRVDSEGDLVDILPTGDQGLEMPTIDPIDIAQDVATGGIAPAIGLGVRRLAKRGLRKGISSAGGGGVERAAAKKSSKKMARTPLSKGKGYIPAEVTDGEGRIFSRSQLPRTGNAPTQGSLDHPKSSVINLKNKSHVDSREKIDLNFDQLRKQMDGDDDINIRETTTRRIGMKLTKSKLKQIIKEEFQDVFGTQPGWQKGGMDPHTIALHALDDYILKNHRDEKNLNTLMQDLMDKITDFENSLQGEEQFEDDPTSGPDVPPTGTEDSPGYTDLRGKW